MDSATPSLVTPFTFVPFTDLQDGDAENLIYLVLSGFVTRPTLPPSLLISAHIASGAGRLLAITKISYGTQFWSPQNIGTVLETSDSKENIYS